MKNYKNYTEEDWDKLKGIDLSKILVEYPQYAKNCDWNKLGLGDWILFFIRHPRFAKRCDWDKIKEEYDKM